jgi:formylglycine-generating enzyme required for sulfatase activity
VGLQSLYTSKSYDPNGYNLHGGNVSEWTDSSYDPHLRICFYNEPNVPRYSNESSSWWFVERCCLLLQVSTRDFEYQILQEALLVSEPFKITWEHKQQEMVKNL